MRPVLEFAWKIPHSRTIRVARSMAPGVVMAMSHSWRSGRPYLCTASYRHPGARDRNKTVKVAVFGANGATGRLLTQLALDEGYEVVAFTRRPHAFPIEHRRLEVAAGDVHDRALSLRQSRGPTRSSRPLACRLPRRRSPCTPTVAPTSLRACTPPLPTGWFVASRAVGPHPEPLGGFIFEKIMQSYVVNKLGKTVYDDMGRMEAMVSGTDLAWTIVRPSGLFEAPAVSSYSVAIDHIGYRFTARIDLADCLLRLALGDAYLRTTVAVATPNAKPSMLKLIWQEGIRKRA